MCVTNIDEREVLIVFRGKHMLLWRSSCVVVLWVPKEAFGAVRIPFVMMQHPPPSIQFSLSLSAR